MHFSYVCNALCVTIDFVVTNVFAVRSPHVCVCCCYFSLFLLLFLSQFSFGSKQAHTKPQLCCSLWCLFWCACRWLLLQLLLSFCFFLSVCYSLGTTQCILCHAISFQAVATFKRFICHFRSRFFSFSFYYGTINARMGCILRQSTSVSGQQIVRSSAKSRCV